MQIDLDLVVVLEDRLVRVFHEQLVLGVTQLLHCILIRVLRYLNCFHYLSRGVLVFLVEQVENGCLVAINDESEALLSEASLNFNTAVQEGPGHLPILIFVLIPGSEPIHCSSHGRR